MFEARQSYRQRTYIGGRIIYNDKRRTLDCLIRNMTPQGARLQFSDAACLPGAFDLMIPNKGQTRSARVAWLRADEAGVVFDDPRDSKVVRFDTAQRTKWLERERERLQARHRLDADQE